MRPRGKRELKKEKDMLVAILAVAMLVAAALVRIVPPSGWHVVDGDTLYRRQRKYRLQGYDSPEWDQPHGRQAKRALAEMLSTGWSVAIITGIDRYGRRKIRLATTRGPVATRMIASGNGHADDIPGAIVQIWARITGKGLWRGRRPVHPRTWRKAHPRQRRLPRGAWTS